MKNLIAGAVPEGAKIGLFGGTFSPPHLGHVRAARLFCEAEDISRLIVMPSHIPPHKDLPDGASDEDRLEMTRLAFGSFAVVSDW
ncbi:MAG: nicotinate-nicotinamide nucleotide adenylyltransferase, partial [Candidatus Avispirillum sp.]